MGAAAAPAVSALERGQELLHGGGQDLVLLVDGGDGARQVRLIQLDFRQRLFADLLNDRVAREDGDAGFNSFLKNIIFHKF